MGLVINVKSAVEPGRKRLNNGAVLSDRKLLEVPVIFVEGKLILLSEVKQQVLQFLATR